MDVKIQKYARRCELAASALMGLVVVRWVGEWIADWVVYWSSRFGDLDLSKYQSLDGAVQKLQFEQLGRFNVVDALLRADFGCSWMGLTTLAKLPWYLRLSGFLCDGVAVGIIALGFWYFIKLMAQLKKGDIFSIDVIELLNKLARVIFWFALYIPINRTLITLIATMQNPPGQRFLVATINFTDIFTLAASWFFVILTSLMRESRQLQEDRDLTV